MAARATWRMGESQNPWWHALVAGFWAGRQAADAARAEYSAKLLGELERKPCAVVRLEVPFDEERKS